jgi:dTDP-4-amino-4,6-dideoxygalactose transaminase
LAVFGGAPRFEEKLHVGRPNAVNRERYLARINEMLDRNWLTNGGPFVREFEVRVAEHLGVRHCIAICNATVALEIVIRAAGLSGEVIVPSMTFVATAHALQWQEITPVFCDIEPDRHTIDPARVEELITPRTTGIIGVHLWGRGCDVDALAAIAQRRGLKLLFDAAHAFSCTHRGRKIGGFGEAEVLSFHATKFFHTLEGGAIVTNDDGLAAKVRLMKNFGFSGYDHVVYLGTNGKMTEASAAMGLTGLEGIEEIRAVNRRNYRAYRERLQPLPGLRVLEYDEEELNNYQYVVVEVDEPAAGLGRDHLLAVLHAENVLARRYFYPGCHRMEPYRSYYPHARLLLPVVERVAGRILVLPTGTAVGEREIGDIARIIETALSSAPRVRQRLAAPPPAAGERRGAA